MAFGDQVPEIPFGEVAFNVGTAEPEQIELKFRNFPFPFVTLIFSLEVQN